MLSLVQVFVLAMVITIPTVPASTSTSTTPIKPAIRPVLVGFSLIMTVAGSSVMCWSVVVWSVDCVLLGVMIKLLAVVGCSGLASSGGKGGSVGGSVGVVGG